MPLRTFPAERVKRTACVANRPLCYLAASADDVVDSLNC